MSLIVSCINLTKQYWIALTIFNFVVISILSLTPLEHLPADQDSDKLQHFIAYAALIFPCALSRTRFWIAICFVAITWGGMIELIQPFANRYGEWLDFVANTAGICIGVLSAFLINYVIQRKEISR